MQCSKMEETGSSNNNTTTTVGSTTSTGSCSSDSSSSEAVIMEDPLLPYLLHDDEYNNAIVSALVTDGYVVLRDVLSSDECKRMLDLIWDYVETTSNFNVSRDSIHSCYPQQHNNDVDPWHNSALFPPDTFQSADSGYLLGPLREILSQRVFEPILFKTSHLYSSKEGFIFHRPRKVLHSSASINDNTIAKDDNDQVYYPHPCYDDNTKSSSSSFLHHVLYGEQPQFKSIGEHYDHHLSPHRGLHTIQSSTAFLSQSPESQSGCFSVYPGSHVLKQHPTPQNSVNMGGSFSCSWTEDEIHLLLHSHGFVRKDIYVNAGDVILWRSDVVHAFTTPGPECTTFYALGHVSMLPIPFCTTATTSTTAALLHKKKLVGYRMGRTTDHRAYLEHWNEIPGEIIQQKPSKDSIKKNHQVQQVKKMSNNHQAKEFIIPTDPFYNRYSPPLLTWRQAQLYGLVPYEVTGKEEFEIEMKRAVVRGVCFVSSNDQSVQSSSSILANLGQSININAITANKQPSSNTIIINDAQLAIVSPHDEPLLGQDKWLGGMPSPDGDYVYGVPGTATQVLRITVADGKVDFIGPKFEGKFKWLRGIDIPSHVMNLESYPKGVCLALPANADCILEINPHTQEVSTYGGPFPGCWKWHGGSLSPKNDVVYAIPANAEQVLRINPRSREAKLIGPKLIGPQKWYGGICASNGCIYGIPLNAGGVLKIEPGNDEHSEDKIHVFGNLPEGDWKWHGGTIDRDGRIIYCFPSNSDYVLKIDTSTDEISFLGGPELLGSAKYKYLGGAIASNDHLYLFPSDAKRVLSINTRNDEVKLVGPLLLEGKNKFQNGFCARDGAVYAIPQHSRGVMRVSPNKNDPEHGEPDVDLLYCGEKLVSTRDKFEGGVFGPKDGAIYCIPLRAKRVLKIIPSSAVTDQCIQ